MMMEVSASVVIAVVRLDFSVHEPSALCRHLNVVSRHSQPPQRSGNHTSLTLSVSTVSTVSLVLSQLFTCLKRVVLLSYFLCMLTMIKSITTWVGNQRSFQLFYRL